MVPLTGNGDVHHKHDGMDPARAQALLAALSLPDAVARGDPLPPFFHHLYFWEVKPPAALGPDGHPALGGLIPDFGLPRRMWAGGRLTFHRPLLAGMAALKETRLASCTQKTGRTGPLAFVTLHHVISQDGAVCVEEEQDLVYRAAATPLDMRSPAPLADKMAGESEPWSFDSTLLFRYSALTMNGHRIHYDEVYARDQEGYDGLVVHGPLLAQLLMLWVRPEKSFAFRATAPLMHHERALLCRDGANFWVEGPDRRLCLRASWA